MGSRLMSADQFEASMDRVRSERDLIKALADIRRTSGDATSGGGSAGARIRDRLLSIRMRAHDGCPQVERELWKALYQHELRITEQNGRKFEDSNFRRRVEALGIVNAAIENILHFRSRASTRLKGVSLEQVFVDNKAVFGSHLCEVARKNLEVRALLAPLAGDPDDE